MSKDIAIISKDDERYPPLLRMIPDGPRLLYCRGSIEALGHPLPLAVVGTRALSRYGETVIRLLTGPLARAGAAIVSGLALGADAAVHEETLQAGGITVAVLAGGVDAPSVGPRTNARLAERIVASGGALISEHPPGTESLKHHFPLRNRIIAGICRATLVIEAPVKSGALITARAALEYNRDVFAVPGPITYPSCTGSNSLIVQGAIPVCGPSDIQEYYGLVVTATASPLPSDPLALAIIDLLGTPQDIDVIATRTGSAPAEIIAALSMLELSGNVVRTVAGWLKKIDSPQSGRLL